MENTSKKYFNHGYILFESLVSLVLIGGLLLLFLPNIAFLLEANQTLGESVKLHQLLYTHTASIGRNGGAFNQHKDGEIELEIGKTAERVYTEVNGYGQKIDVYREF